MDSNQFAQHVAENTERWATVLTPYLTGATQDTQETLGGSEVKPAMLDPSGVSTGTYQQGLRPERFRVRDQPQAVAQRIWDVC